MTYGLLSFTCTRKSERQQNQTVATAALWRECKEATLAYLLRLLSWYMFGPDFAKETEKFSFAQSWIFRKLELYDEGLYVACRMDIAHAVSHMFPHGLDTLYPSPIVATMLP